MACLFIAGVLWSAPASAHIFAPICDPSGASAIAPLPIYTRNHGEIRVGNCIPMLPHAAIGRGLPEQEEQRTNVAPLVRLFLPSLDDVKVHGAPRVKTGMDLEEDGNISEAHASSVYRPPRR